MAEIIWKESSKPDGDKLNCRQRRKEKRKKEFESKKSQEVLEKKITETLMGCSYKVVKAIDLPPDNREEKLEDAGGDAMFKVVNHAHQRSPSKKW